MTERAASRSSGQFPPLRDLPWHVVLVPSAATLNAWVNARIYPGAMVRSLVIALVTAVLLTAVLTLATRSVVVAGLMTTAITIIFLSWIPYQMALFVADVLAPWQLAILSLLVLTAFGISGAIALRAARRGSGVRVLNRNVNTLATIFTAIVFVHGGAAITIDGMPGARTSQGPVGATRARASDPDIYMILLDGYPRADTLSGVFAFDNSPFLDALRRRGFEVSNGSRSNYTFTEGTLASMFSDSYLDDTALTATDNARSLSGLINNGSVLSRLQGADYRIETVAPIFPQVRINTADAVRDGGGLTDFEYQLLNTTWLLDIITGFDRELIPSWQRDAVSGSFAAGTQLAEEPAPQGPRFSFIHVVAPHDPIVVRRDGSVIVPATPRSAYSQTPVQLGLSLAGYREAYTSEIQYVNDHTLALLDAIAAGPGTRPKVVILFSDHGFRDRTIPIDEVPSADLRPRFGTLFAAHTPGKDSLFPQNVDDLSILPILMRAYLGIDLPTYPYRAFLPDGARFTEISPGF